MIEGLSLLLAIIAVAGFRRQRRLLNDLQSRQARQATELDRLTRRLNELGPGTTGPTRPTPTATAASPESIKALSTPPLHPVTPADAPPIAERPKMPPSIPVTAPPTPSSPPPITPAAPTVTAPSAPRDTHTAAPGARPPEPPGPSWIDRGREFDWESLVGVKLFSWVAGIALALAAVFFLRYSIDRGWLSAPIRMAIGLLTGAGLLVTCELRAARRYPVTANALDASGVVILFATLFASHVLWKLIPQLPVFALMSLVTATAVLLSIRHDSIFIALLGLIGGFATPALLSTGENHPVGLFGYLLLLNAGVAWVAYRKQWPVLNTITVVLTALYQWAWVMKFLATTPLPLAAGIFLVFPVLHMIALALAHVDRQEPAARALSLQNGALAAVLPLLFAAYMAAVPAYGTHSDLLFAFLLVIAAGLAAQAVLQGPEILHLVGASSVVSVLAIWFGLSYTHAAWPGILAWVAALVALYLAVPVVAARWGRALGPTGDTAGHAAALVFLAFPALIWREPATASPGVLFGALFVMLALVAAAAVRRGGGSLYAIAAFFAVAAEAAWSARYLTPAQLLPALMLYGGFGLFYVGVPVAARAYGKPLRPEGSGALLLLVSLALLLFLASGPAAKGALWGMALLLAILNVGLVAEGSWRRWPLVTIAGAILSWIVIGIWWVTALTAAVLVPALAIVAGFALLVVASHVWVTEHEPAAGATRSTAELGVGLGLVGHVFLWFVASQPALAVPPWPFLAVLGVLDLALAAAALWLRRGDLLAQALGASQLILAWWLLVAPNAPWPLVGVLVAAAVVAIGLAWIPLARRQGEPAGWFERAGVAAIFLAQLVAVVAGQSRGSPETGVMALNHVALLIALAAIVWITGWDRLLPVAVATSGLAGWLWQNDHLSAQAWGGELAFAACVYGVFLGYPLLRGRRGTGAREPHLAAVLASVTFFFLARECIIAGELESVIGVLPLTESAALLVLLIQLLRIEPPETRDLGRLALVAGAALAGVTLAIPLQLDRQWITIGWALEAAALAWLYRRISHRGLLCWIAGLGAAVFIRLSLNPAVLAYHVRGALPIWNWYLYTYLVSATALGAAAYWLRGCDDTIGPNWPGARGPILGAAVILLFLLLNIEIADFYSTGMTLTFNFSADLGQDLTYTLGWAVFAIAILTAGIVGRNRSARAAALGLLVVTVLKCFLHDLMRLGGLYRVGSFVGLAVSLALVAIVLQKFVLKAEEKTP